MNVCTIIAKNYVAFARVLAASLRAHHPDSTLNALVLDDTDGYLDAAEEPFTLLRPDEIGCEEFAAMAERYTVLELSTAVKPWLLETLVQRDDHAVYLDPDIEIVGDLGPIRELALEHGIVLTPHTLTPIPRDGRQPQEQALLISGAYNLGFIGVGRSAQKMLRWWQERLTSDCVVDVANGLFVDQKWIDLVPSLWPQTFVLDDPGYNVAYWNYHERTISEAGDGSLLVNDRPGRFLHFSGFDPLRPDRLSKYEDRVDLAARSDIAGALDRYGRALLDAGHEETRTWPYAIAELGIGPSGAGDLPGVNVIGYLDSEHGVGEAGRQLIAALDDGGVDVVPITIPSGVSREQHPFEHPGIGGSLQPVTVFCVNADVLPEVVHALGRGIMSGRRNVGFWWWETERFPVRWRPSADLVDEVWAGSRFAADAISLTTTKPVAVIPTPVTLSCDPQPDRARLGLPDGFVFLFIFDFNSVARRKNPLGLVEAFRRAFPEPADDVGLVIKSINGHRHLDEQLALERAVAARPDILLLDEHLDHEEREILVASCDCYVSLHRSEGFGLTIGEAMLLGKPVIATGYGGCTEMVSEATAYPVRYERVPVGPGAAPYDPDELWAEPDLDHAAELMRHVVADRTEAERVGARGREHLLTAHSPQAAGRAIAERLRHLGASDRAAEHADADSVRLMLRAGSPDLPDAERARRETLELLRHTPDSPHGARGLAARALRRLTRGESRARRENENALWWSVEASAVVASERHEDLVHAVKAHERLLDGLKADLARLRAENEDLRLMLGRLELERRRGRAADGLAAASHPPRIDMVDVAARLSDEAAPGDRA